MALRVIEHHYSALFSTTFIDNKILHQWKVLIDRAYQLPDEDTHISTANYGIEYSKG